jgi:hypothetical protein
MMVHVDCDVLRRCILTRGEATPGAAAMWVWSTRSRWREQGTSRRFGSEAQIEAEDD